MGHYAKIVDGKVETVIVAEADFIEMLTSTTSETWIQTSYNTRGGKHYDPITNIEDTSPTNIALRKNYAGIGYTYDSDRDAFIPPKPYESWVLNDESCLWNAPIAYPSDGKLYDWDENSKQWVELPSISTDG